MVDPGSWTLGSGSGIVDHGSWIQDPGFQVEGIQDPGDPAFRMYITSLGSRT